MKAITTISYHALAVATVFAIFQSHAFAQAPVTCADLQWPPQLNTNAQINSPNAGKSSIVDSLSAKSDAAKKKSFLKCDAEPLLVIKSTDWTLSDEAQADSFKQGVVSALKEGKLSRVTLAQAIYLTMLFPNKEGAQAANIPSSIWRVEQAKQFCAQHKDQDSEDVSIPPKLLTLGEAVRQLNPRAIELSWQVINELDVRQMQNGCTAAVKQFVNLNKQEGKK